jgi:hypothetical protein
MVDGDFHSLRFSNIVYVLLGKFDRCMMIEMVDAGVSDVVQGLIADAVVRLCVGVSNGTDGVRR